MITALPPILDPTSPDVQPQRTANNHSPPSHGFEHARVWSEPFKRFYAQTPHPKPKCWRRYYHRRIQARLIQLIEPNARVLDVGCGTGELLASVRPSVGVGVDFSSEAIREARRRHPNLRFAELHAEAVHTLGDTYDYVILSQVLGEVYDLGALLASIRKVCHARTRLIVVHYNRVWQPVLRLAEWLRLKPRAPEQNWLPTDEVEHLLKLSGFEAIRSFGMTIMPFEVPGLSNLINRTVGNLPLVHHFGLNYVMVARLTPDERVESTEARQLSIVVPARNEAGHIDSILQRIPEITPHQEIIFVEGHSRDDTWSAITMAVATYTGPWKVRCFRQSGVGKGNAVREAFEAATGDVLCILDADLSVPPEELTRFYEALVKGHGEFINGSRMVYIMDRRAMRLLNLLGNKMFGWIFTYLLSQRFRDTLCGTKLLLRRDYERIARNRAYFGNFDPFGDFDLLFGAARLSLKIVDVPVHYKARVYGETNISRFRHGWLLLKMCAIAARKLRFI